MNEAFAQLEEDGYWLEPEVVSPPSLNELLASIEAVPKAQWQARKDGTPFAVRNAHLKLNGLLAILERAGVVSFAASLLRTTPHPVSAVAFDKPEGANWSVPLIARLDARAANPL